MRVEAGAVVDEFELIGIGHVVARYTRSSAPETVGWACVFTVVASGIADLAVVHRLSAPSLADARRSVRQAVEFMAGRAADPDLRADLGPHLDPPRDCSSGTVRPVTAPPVFRLPRTLAPAPPST